MRAALGRLISPPSGCSSPRMSLNRVDLPTPLRPTSPTLAPTGSDTDAPSKNRRPQPLKMRLSIWSMGLGAVRRGRKGAAYRVGSPKAREIVAAQQVGGGARDSFHRGGLTRAA